jgi:diacylglycerol kinase (ATP)
MRSGGRALILINAKARRGQEMGSEATKMLRSAGLTLIEEQPVDASGLGAAIRRHRDDVDLVVIGGGDGTLSGAAESLVETQLPLGILPLGTANDLARTLAIPLDLSGACSVILDGVQHRIDLGRVNERYYFNVASLGLSVLVAKNLRSQLKRRWGLLAYAIIAARALRRERSFRAKIACDGRRTRLRSIQLTVGNGRHYGGGLTMSEDAGIDDHVLDLYSIAPVRWWRLLWLVPLLKSGRLRRTDGVRLMRGRRITVRTRRPMEINTDGEVTTHTPAVFEVVPDAVTVLVPQAYLASRAAG